MEKKNPPNKPRSHLSAACHPAPIHSTSASIDKYNLGKTYNIHVISLCNLQNYLLSIFLKLNCHYKYKVVCGKKLPITRL